MSQDHTSVPRGRTDPTEDDLRRVIPRATGGQEIRIGIFVLIGVFSVFAALFLLTDPGTFRGRYMVTTTVTNAGGLRAGDPVQMKGVNIGRVHEFALVPEGVTITLEIEGEWQIPVDSYTRLLSGGLVGGGRIVDVVGGSSAESLPPGGDLPGGDLSGVLDTVDQVGTHATAVLTRIETLFTDPTIEAVQSSIDEMRALLRDLSEVARTQGAELERLTGTLNRAAEGIEEASTSGPDLARAIARADSALVQINATTTTLDQAVASLQTLLTRMERGEGTLGQLSTNDSLYQNINRAAESVYLLATDLRENPRRYLTVEIF
jgi:phospholipid/cholesterol/gamma-HCH transport system substrate-binding protein